MLMVTVYIWMFEVRQKCNQTGEVEPLCLQQVYIYIYICGSPE